MVLFIENEIREKARKTIEADKKHNNSYAARSARSILLSKNEFVESHHYDIFLSHSVRDCELMLGMRETLVELGYSVYVDWFEDPTLDKPKLTPDTANLLRKRMQRAKSLLYVTNENIESSKWMPWECGYFDGLKEKVAIVPIKSTDLANYYGKEYLSFYPWCVKDEGILKIFKDNKTYSTFEHWLKTKNAMLQWRKI
jgi:hypothetical protein